MINCVGTGLRHPPWQVCEEHGVRIRPRCGHLKPRNFDQTFSLMGSLEIEIDRTFWRFILPLLPNNSNCYEQVRVTSSAIRGPRAAPPCVSCSCQTALERLSHCFWGSDQLFKSQVTIREYLHQIGKASQNNMKYLRIGRKKNTKRSVCFTETCWDLSRATKRAGGHRPFASGIPWFHRNRDRNQCQTNSTATTPCGCFCTWRCIALPAFLVFEAWPFVKLQAPSVVSRSDRQTRKIYKS